jgi:hypothetical protein
MYNRMIILDRAKHVFVLLDRDTVRAAEANGIKVPSDFQDPEVGPCLCRYRFLRCKADVLLVSRCER